MMLTIVAAAIDGSDPSRFLDALAADGILGATDVEVVIVQSQSGPVHRDTPRVIVKTIGAQASIFELWGAGLREARADAVAFLDVRCPPCKGWLASVRAALPLSGSGVFGPVACRMRDNDPHIVGYLTEYVQFSPPLDADCKEVPGVNLIAAKSLASDRRVLGEDGFVKTRFLALLSVVNAPLPRPVANAVVEYQKSYRFGEYLMHRFRHGRCYAGQRQLPSFTAWLVAVLATPCLPIIRSRRIFRNARHEIVTARAARRFWLRIVMAETAWSLGELLGYTLGEGRARQRLR